MSKKRFAIVAVAALVATACTNQAGPVQPGPAEDAQVAGSQALPFSVPEGALFVARTPSSTRIYRIRAACRPLQAMNASRVKFFWTLEAGLRAGHRLSEEEGCR